MMISSHPYDIPPSTDINIIHYWDAEKEEKILNVEKYFNCFTVDV